MSHSLDARAASVPAGFLRQVSADDYTLEGGPRRAGKWRADDEDLEPKTYDYHLGADFGEVDA